MLWPSLCKDIALPGGAVLGSGGGVPSIADIWFSSFFCDASIGLLVRGSELKIKNTQIQVSISLTVTSQQLQK